MHASFPLEFRLQHIRISISNFSIVRKQNVRIRFCKPTKDTEHNFLMSHLKFCLNIAGLINVGRRMRRFSQSSRSSQWHCDRDVFVLRLFSQFSQFSELASAPTRNERGIYKRRFATYHLAQANKIFNTGSSKCCEI